MSWSASPFANPEVAAILDIRFICIKVMSDWDGDGRPGLIITRINESVLVLTPRDAPNGRAFAVKLTGEPSNPDAIGARITVVC